MHYDRLLKRYIIQMAGNTFKLQRMCLYGKQQTTLSDWEFEFQVNRHKKCKWIHPFYPTAPMHVLKHKERRALTLWRIQKSFQERHPAWKISTIQKGESDIVFIVSKGVPCAYLELCVNIWLRHTPTLLPWANCSANAAHTERSECCCGLRCCDPMMLLFSSTNP